MDARDITQTTSVAAQMLKRRRQSMFVEEEYPAICDELMLVQGLMAVAPYYSPGNTQIGVLVLFQQYSQITGQIGGVGRSCWRQIAA
jgi:hypothetical protein